MLLNSKRQRRAVIPAQANGLGSRPQNIARAESPSYPLSIPHREQPPLATHGEIKGDTVTLEDFQVIAKLRESEEG